MSIGSFFAPLFFGLSIPLTVGFTVFRLCPKYKVDKMAGYTTVTLGLIAAAYGAHWWYLASHPPTHPSSWFFIDGGFSSSGAIIGGVLFGSICAVFFKIPATTAIVAALEAGVIGLWVVRVGCTLLAEHLGSPTSFMWAAIDSQGVARHNLGLYELLFLSALLVPFVLWSSRKSPHKLMSFGVIVIGYACFKVGTQIFI